MLHDLIQDLRSAVRSLAKHKTFAATAISTLALGIGANTAIFSVDVKTLERVIADSLSGFTMYLSLMASFAALAFVLASTGVYGVISYVATSRTRELAIRVALGADRSLVTHLVLGQGARLTVTGLGLGLCGTLASVPLLQGLPVSVRPPDVLTVAPVVVSIAVIALVACLVPARRAANVDPMSVLRKE